MVGESSVVLSNEASLWRGGLEFRTLAEMIPCMVFVTDRDGLNVYTNVQFQRFTGVAPEDLRGDGWLNVLHPEDRERAEKTWSTSAIEGTSNDTRYRFRRHDGQYRWHIVRASPVPDPSGGFAQWIGSCTDADDVLTAPKGKVAHSSELQSADSERTNDNFQVTVDALPIIVWEADQNGLIQRVNAAWHGSLSGPRMASPGFQDIVAPHALSEFVAQWEHCIANGEIFDCKTVIMDRFVGEKIVSALATPTWIDNLNVSRDRWIGSFS